MLQERIICNTKRNQFSGISVRSSCILWHRTLLSLWGMYFFISKVIRWCTQLPRLCQKQKNFGYGERLVPRVMACHGPIWNPDLISWGVLRRNYAEVDHPQGLFFPWLGPLDANVSWLVVGFGPCFRAVTGLEQKGPNGGPMGAEWGPMQAQAEGGSGDWGDYDLPAPLVSPQNACRVLLVVLSLMHL